MSQGTTNSSRTFNNTSWCLICCSAYPKLNLSTSRPNSSDDDNDKNRLAKATEKIFQLLLIPKKQFEKVKKTKCLLSFCPNCMLLVEDIIQLQKKAEILELQIQWKVETLGRIASDTSVDAAIAGNCEKSRKQVAEVWKSFKSHITQSFRQGLLPNPSVRLEKTLNVRTKAETQERKALCRKSKPPYSKTTSKASIKSKPGHNKKAPKDGTLDCIKLKGDIETGGNICEVVAEKDIPNRKDDDEDSDSNDDLFETVTIPLTSRNTKAKRNESNPKKLEPSETVLKTHEVEDVCAGIPSNIPTVLTPDIFPVKEEHNYHKNESPGSKNENAGKDNDSVIQSSDVITNSNSHTQNEKKEQVTIKIGVWLGDIYNEINQTSCGNHQENISMEQNIAEINHTRPSISDRVVGNAISSDKDIEVSRSYSGLNPAPTQPKEQKTCKTSMTRSQNIVNVRDSNLPIVISKDEKMKILQGLTEGRDYFKCTKCDYFAKRTSTSKCNQDIVNSLRNKIADHYTLHHNPVNSTDKTKRIDGKYYYMCTKCTFYTIFQTNTSSDHHNARQKLSLHYMRVHDVLESESNTETAKKLPSITEGIDYFSCPSENCTYKANIKSEKSPKHQLANATEARLRIIEHFRSSSVHIDEGKQTLSFINSSSVVFKNLNGSFYKCSKCDFKACIEKCETDFTLNSDGKAKAQARKSMKVHFLYEHVFPWEKFPGLYKYGCYEEKIEDTNVLKCPYSGCDYIYKIRYDLKGKTPEECKQTAYQAFLYHASNHNFNSISFTSNNPVYDKYSENNDLPNDDQDILLNRDADDSNGFKCFEVTPDSQLTNMSYEDIEVENKIWVGDIEDTEEMCQTYNSQESIEQNNAQIRLVEQSVYNHEMDNTSSSDREFDTSGNDCDSDSGPTQSKRRKRDMSITISEKETNTSTAIPGDPGVPKELESLIEGQDYMKCTKCDYYARKTSTNPYYDIRSSVADHYSNYHNPVKQNDVSTTLGNNSCYKCTKCAFSIVFKSDIPSPRYFHIRKLSLHYMEVHDAIDSQKIFNPDQTVTSFTEENECFETEQNSTSEETVTSLAEIIEHFETEQSSTSEETVTSHTERFEYLETEQKSTSEETATSVTEGNEYFETQQNSTSEETVTSVTEGNEYFETQQNSTSEETVTSVTEGNEYFPCPIKNCTFVACIIKEKNKKQQVQNAAEARLKIIDHFLMSGIHPKELKAALSDIANTPLTCTPIRGSCYKCYKCSFKSPVKFQQFQQDANSSSKERVIANNNLIIHYLLEHILPWKNFSGLYKYGCYEVESVAGNILKCVYSDCDYFVKIYNDLAVRNQEHCKLAAYNSFFKKHAMNHNFNSFGIVNYNPFSAQPFEQVLGGRTTAMPFNKEDYKILRFVSTPTGTPNPNPPSQEKTIVNQSNNTEVNPLGQSLFYFFQSGISDTKQNQSGISNSNRRLFHLGDNRNSSSTHMQPKREKFEGLIEGQDYFKCTKCDYFAKKMSTYNFTQNRPSSLRQKILSHYTKHHLPISETDKSKTIVEGKNCFKCTKCSFTIIFRSDMTNCNYSLQKLSLHYMEVHDPSESQSNSNSDDRIKSPTEQIDYFLCPFKHCNFLAPIERDENPREQLQNAVEARLKVIQHYRLSSKHIKERADTLFDILAMDLKCVTENERFYQCTKCDFKSFVPNTFSKLNERTASNTLVDHFLHQHVFPWENFPGLYKYGCYEDKSEDGNVLKCFYLDCDFCVKIQYKSEGKTPEEAYQSFTDHSINHNFNSINLIERKHISTKPANEALSLKKVPSVSKVIPLNNEEDDPNKIQNELEGLLIEGVDYLKCTKCDYFARKICDDTYLSVLRSKIAIHYSRVHNPVKTGDESKTPDGKYCYKCTKCTFSVVIKYVSACQSSLRILSLHYMDVHDVFEGPSNSHYEDRLKSLTVGVDYFVCHVTNCTFVAFIQKDECPKQQLRNAMVARFKLIEHYRISRIHFQERKETLLDINNRPLVFEDEGVSYYNCTMCDFKSVAGKCKKYAQNPRIKARNTLTLHFLLEHAFAWEKFPGFYKYGCYEEKCEDGNVLKCPYSDCDHFLKIQYDKEGKTEEECKITAYQAFIDHAKTHNYNSFGFGEDNQNQSSAELGEEGLVGIGNVPNESQDIQSSEEGIEDHLDFESLGVTTNPTIFDDMNSEEVKVESNMLFGDYEDVEEMNPALTDPDRLVD